MVGPCKCKAKFIFFPLKSTAEHPNFHSDQFLGWTELAEMILLVQSSPQTKGSSKRVLERREFSYKIGLNAGAFQCLLKVLGCFAVFQNNSVMVIYCQYNCWLYWWRIKKLYNRRRGKLCWFFVFLHK